MDADADYLGKWEARAHLVDVNTFDYASVEVFEELVNTRKMLVAWGHPMNYKPFDPMDYATYHLDDFLEDRLPPPRSSDPLPNHTKSILRQPKYTVGAPPVDMFIDTAKLAQMDADTEYLGEWEERVHLADKNTFGSLQVFDELLNVRKMLAAGGHPMNYEPFSPLDFATYQLNTFLEDRLPPPTPEDLQTNHSTCYDDEASDEPPALADLVVVTDEPEGRIHTAPPMPEPELQVIKPVPQACAEPPVPTSPTPKPPTELAADEPEGSTASLMPESDLQVIIPVPQDCAEPPVPEPPTPEPSPESQVIHSVPPDCSELEPPMPELPAEEVQVMQLKLLSHTKPSKQTRTSRQPRRRRSPRRHQTPPTRRSARIAAMNRNKK